MKALVLSLSTAREAQMRADIDELLEAGHSVELVVTKGQRWEDLPTAVRMHSLATVEYRHPVLRAERFVVLTLPRYIYKVVARILQLAARLLPGRVGRKFEILSGQAKKVWVATREGSKRFHKEKWARWYGFVRPWFLWRATRRHIVPQLDGPWDVIIVGDALSTPIGWKLARRLPQASVGFSLDEALDAGTDPGR